MIRPVVPAAETSTSGIETGVVDRVPVRAPATQEDRGSATTTSANRARWFDTGGAFVGGSLRGFESKNDYLSRSNAREPGKLGGR
jgi:hypothetical protein